DVALAVEVVEHVEGGAREALAAGALGVAGGVGAPGEAGGESGPRGRRPPSRGPGGRGGRPPARPAGRRPPSPPPPPPPAAPQRRGAQVDVAPVAGRRPVAGPERGERRGGRFLGPVGGGLLQVQRVEVGGAAGAGEEGQLLAVAARGAPAVVGGVAGDVADG